MPRKSNKELLPDKVLENFAKQKLDPRFNPQIFSKRGRELIDILRTLTPLAQSVNSGNKEAKSILKILLKQNYSKENIPTQRQYSSAALLSSISNGFVAHQECEESLEGAIQVLNAAYRLDKEEGKRKNVNVRNAISIILSSRRELQYLSSNNRLLMKDVRKLEQRRIMSRINERYRSTRTYGTSRSSLITPEYTPRPGGGLPDPGEPFPVGPGGTLPDPVEPESPDLCADLTDLIIGLFESLSHSWRSNPYENLIKSVEPSCLRFNELPDIIKLNVRDGSKFPAKDVVKLTFEGGPLHDDQIISWDNSTIEVNVLADSTSGGFYIGPILWQPNQPGVIGAVNIDLIRALGFPNTSPLVPFPSDVILNIIYRPKVFVTIDGDSGPNISVEDCTPVRVEWSLLFKKERTGWVPPECVNLLITINGPDNQNIESNNLEGFEDLEAKTSDGEIIVTIIVQVNGIDLHNTISKFNLTRTQTIIISGPDKIISDRSSYLTAKIPCNAPAGGQLLYIISDPRGKIMHPNSVLIPEHYAFVNFEINAIDRRIQKEEVKITITDPNDLISQGHKDLLVCSPTYGLALSGGGAKGCFQAGVYANITRNWEELRIKVVCGVSVGSINSLGIAEDEGLESSIKMEKIWLGLRENTDMFQEEPLARKIKELLADEIEILFDNISSDDIMQFNIVDLIFLGEENYIVPKHQLIKGMTLRGNFTIKLSLKWWQELLLSAFSFGLYGSQVHYGIKGYGEAKKIYSIVSLIQALDDKDDEIIQLLETDSKRSFFTLDPVRIKLKKVLDEQKLNDTSMKVRLGSIDIESGEMVWIDENGNIIHDRNANSVSERRSRASLLDSLIDGAMASSAIPGVFNAVEIEKANGNLHLCVDGGVRDNLPARAAFELGVDTVIGITVGNSDMEFEEVSNITNVISRSLMDIMSNEIGIADREDIYKFNHNKIQILIEPLQTVNETTEIEPGLIRINLAYGYMKAHDVLTAYFKNISDNEITDLENSTESIISLRKEIWKKENYIICKDNPYGRSVKVEHLEDVRNKKIQLLAKLVARFDKWGIESLPVLLGQGRGSSSYIMNWWLDWEDHLDYLKDWYKRFKRVRSPWSRHMVHVIGSASRFRESEPNKPNPPQRFIDEIGRVFRM